MRVPVVVQRRASQRRTAVGRALWTCAEMAVTVGVVVLLLVVHQLWWTNQQARADADRTVRALEEEWGAPPDPPPTPTPPPPPTSPPSLRTPTDAPEDRPRSQPPDPAAPTTAPRRAYAVLKIPSLGLAVPVAQGIDKRGVLDKGYAGHYPGTALPGRPGNFALAGHRNTHGEPFRRIDRLRKGDSLVVETREATYTYVVDSALPTTSPRDTGVIAAIPRSLVKPRYGYSAPGRYLTLTTCTPEFSSTYRLIVWAVLRETVPRGQGDSV
ncbi:class E sortase [Streptomyces purpureus]|uniref:class E sortase n=2 Tax=Streptomyces purpureus TaxID=1951 RepID=UPI0035EBB598